MPIGTDDGQTYKDTMEHKIAPFVENQNRPGEFQPQLEKQKDDNIVNPNSGRLYISPNDRRSGSEPFQVSDIEDRRDSPLANFQSALSQFSPSALAEKLHAIWQNPTPGSAGQTLTANLPHQQSAMGDQLGYSDIGKPEPPAPDYDYKGWQDETGLKELPEGQHYPDTYKLPNHITFSNDSKYSNDDTPGGKWTHEGEDEKTGWTFTPSSYNLLHHSPSELKDYFAREEEPHGNKLNLSTAAGMAAEATEKARGALKQAGSYPPTFDSDTGINGPVIQSIKGLRERGLDPNITGGDVDKAINLGLSFSGGGLTFGGVKAKTMPHRMEDLQTAQTMEQAGQSPWDIHHETGWHRGADNRWKFEIPDENSKMIPSEESLGMTKASREQMKKDAERKDDNTPKGWKYISNGPMTPWYEVRGKGTTVKDILDHPTLFNEYPHLGDIKVQQTSGLDALAGTKGWWNEGSKTIALANGSLDSMRSTLMHELQHAIQSHEGFSRGGNPEMFGGTRWPELNTEFEEKKAQTEQVLKSIGGKDTPVWEIKSLFKDPSIFENLQKKAEGARPGKYTVERYERLKGVLNKIYDIPGFNNNIVDMLKGEEIQNAYKAAQHAEYRKIKGEAESRNVQARLDPNRQKMVYEEGADIFRQNGLSLDLIYGAPGRPDQFSLRKWQTPEQVDPSTLPPFLKEVWDRLTVGKKFSEMHPEETSDVPFEKQQWSPMDIERHYPGIIDQRAGSISTGSQMHRASYAFKRPDSELLANKRSAFMLQKHMQDYGHKAFVESLPTLDEHRVWLQHPTDENMFAYVKPKNADNPRLTPDWEQK